MTTRVCKRRSPCFGCRCAKRSSYSQFNCLWIKKREFFIFWSIRIKWKHCWAPPLWRSSLLFFCSLPSVGCGGCISHQPSRTPFRQVSRYNSSLPGGHVRRDRNVPSLMNYIWPWILFFGMLLAQFLLCVFRKNRSSFCPQCIKLIITGTNGKNWNKQNNK